MPELRRAGKPTLHYALDDHTIQNLMPATLAREVLYFAGQHDGIACREP